MAQMMAVMQMMQSNKTKDGAKAQTGMMQQMQKASPSMNMMQSTLDNFSKFMESAIPLKGAIDEALNEVSEVFSGAFMEGFAPAMEVIIETLTKPEVLSAITQLGVAFADIFISLAPLVEYLLPAFIWVIKAAANVFIFIINVLVIVAGIVVAFQNFFADIINFFGGKVEKWAMPTFFDWVAADGADFFTNGPTSILAGEAGREHVQITPAGEESTGGGITVIVNAGTVITERELENTIRRTVDDVMRDNHLLK